MARFIIKPTTTYRFNKTSSRDHSTHILPLANPSSSHFFPNRHRYRRATSIYYNILLRKINKLEEEKREKKEKDTQDFRFSIIRH